MTADALVDTWHVSNRVNLMLLGKIDAAGLRSTLSARGGRDVARQFAHMHNVRLTWLEVAAKDLRTGLQTFGPKVSPARDDKI